MAGIGRAIATGEISKLPGYGGYLSIGPQTRELLTKHLPADDLDAMLREYGITESIGHLTNSQGQYLASFRSLDSLRDRLLAEGQKGFGAENVGLSPEDKSDDAKTIARERREGMLFAGKGAGPSLPGLEAAGALNWVKVEFEGRGEAYIGADQHGEQFGIVPEAGKFIVIRKNDGDGEKIGVVHTLEIAKRIAEAAYKKDGADSKGQPRRSKNYRLVGPRAQSDPLRGEFRITAIRPD